MNKWFLVSWIGSAHTRTHHDGIMDLGDHKELSPYANLTISYRSSVTTNSITDALSFSAPSGIPYRRIFTLRERLSCSVNFVSIWAWSFSISDKTPSTFCNLSSAFSIRSSASSSLLFAFVISPLISASLDLLSCRKSLNSWRIRARLAVGSLSGLAELAFPFWVPICPVF